MKNKYLIVTQLAALLFVITSTFSHAETIITWGGAKTTGRVGDFSENIVKFYSDQYLTIQLSEIREAYIDVGVTGKEAKAQQLKIDKLLFIINQEKYLRLDLRKKSREHLLNEEFSKLEKLASNALNKKLRYPSGNWQLAHVYWGLDEGVASRDVAEYERRSQLIKKWIQMHPESVTAKISLMSIGISYAWAYRGTGYASTVTDGGNKKFKEK